MSSAMPGAGTLAVEVTNVSPHGFWLLLDERELYLPFSEFPFFREATIAALSDVRLTHPGHLHWPQLDVDLSVDCIENPEAYPLTTRVRSRIAEGEGENR